MGIEPSGKGAPGREHSDPWVRAAPGWFQGCHSGCMFVMGIVAVIFLAILGWIIFSS